MKSFNAIKVLPIVLMAGFWSFVAAAEGATTLNGFRAANGLSALASSGGLTALARSHAADMARRESLDHEGFMEKRARRGARSENVGYGCADTACIMQAWINSSDHRANMLLTGISRYGLASAVSASGQRYWALELGR